VNPFELWRRRDLFFVLLSRLVYFRHVERQMPDWI
jgi:hypothetical protein